jgi:hypothetical protein
VLLPEDMKAKFGKAWAATEDREEENDGNTKADVI